MVDILLTFIGLLATAFSVASTLPQIRKALRTKDRGRFYSISYCSDRRSFSVGHIRTRESRYCDTYWQLYWCIIEHLHASS